MKILVCDDKPSQCERTMNAIRSKSKVTGLAGNELKSALTGLFDSVARALQGEGESEEWDSSNEFSGYDVAIVDNNLTALELEGARLTAETIVGYLRAFTDIPYIVSLNKNLHVDFDLRYLFGDYQSLADLALNTEHLRNDRLWDAEARQEFSPWYWPRLAEAAERRREQVRFLKARLDEPVWSELGFPVEADEYLSLRAKSPLLSGELEAQEARFDVFLGATRTLPPAEMEMLRNLADDGAEGAREAMCRIAAYEVDRWVRRDVLGTQDVLIDLPHLVAQMPFLVGEKADDVKGWNAIVAAVEPNFGLDRTLFEKHLAPARFLEEIWVPGPCFWWPSLKGDRDLTKRFFDAEGNWPDAVFCEDVSRFVVIGNDGEDGSPLEFQTELEGSWGTRYIAYVPAYAYTPRSRILGNAR